MRLPVVAVAAASMLLIGTATPIVATGAPGAAPDLSAPAAEVLAATDSSAAPIPGTGALSDAIGPLLARMGADSTAAVFDGSDGSLLYGARASAPMIPASSLKILTAVAALRVLGPQTRLTTSVVSSGKGRIVIVGGGDSTLTSTGVTDVPAELRPASLADLADQTAAALQSSGVSAIRLGYDASLFAAPYTAPAWSRSFASLGVVAPVTALMVDGGRLSPQWESRSPDPARLAAETFARMLGDRGITVTSIDSAQGDGGTQLAAVASPTLMALVQRMLTDSDNDLAEALAHLAGASLTGIGTFASGAKAVEETVAALGLSADGLAISDGSGLARTNLVPAGVLAGALAVATGRAVTELSAVLPGLPVAGATGTLADRFLAPPDSSAAGLVRAKTGTLTGVVSLAGTVRDRDGRILTFAVMAQGASIDSARALADRIAATLAECGCA